MASPGQATVRPLAAAQSVDPVAFVDLSGPARAAVSFVLVALFGAALLSVRGPAVDRAVDRTVEGSPVAVFYGLLAFGLFGFVAGYLLTQALSLGLGGPVLRWVGTAVVGAGALTLAGFGYTVVGTWLTEVEGPRRPWPGAVVGAVLSALPWLVLPAVPALVVWIAGAAVGLGSTTRHWVHGARDVEAERNA